MGLKFQYRPQSIFVFEQSPRSHKITLKVGDDRLSDATAALATAVLGERQNDEFGDYFPGVTPKKSKELVSQTAGEGYLFLFDEVFRRQVGIGARLNEDESVTLVNMQGEPLPSSRVSMITINANYFYRDFLIEGNEK